MQLLTALQEDADRTNVELARLVGLSPAATLHRVRRLKETGVIRVIRAQLDPAAAGFPLQVYVTATLARHDPRSSRVFDDQIRALPQIIAADNVAGETDYLLTVVARDVAELQTVLASLATRGGQRLVTYLRLAEVKPPTRLPLAPTGLTSDRPVRRRRPSKIIRPNERVPRPPPASLRPAVTVHLGRQWSGTSSPDAGRLVPVQVAPVADRRDEQDGQPEADLDSPGEAAG